MRHKKLIIGTGICLLGIALSAAWFVPCKLEATYAGKTPYQYDVISAKSFHASTVSLLGRKNPVTDVSISPKELSKSPQNITEYIEIISRRASTWLKHAHLSETETYH